MLMKRCPSDFVENTGEMGDHLAVFLHICAHFFHRLDWIHHRL